MNLSIFFPAYNEEKNIEATVRKALDVARDIEEVEKFEIIIVDDGSTDKTGEIADRLASEIPEVRVVHHQPNRGYGGALKTGLYESQYEWIVFTDSDGQFDFGEVTKFIEKTQRTSHPAGNSPESDSFPCRPDLILGYRLRRADPLVRKLNSKLWGLLVRLLFGLKVQDRACGFKMIRKKVVETISHIESDGAFAEDELLIKAKQTGFRFTEVGVHHFPRKYGSQTGANIGVILKAFKDLFALWRKLCLTLQPPVA